MTAPAVAARRTVSSAARAARACGQSATPAERGGAIVWPASASLVAQDGPAWAIRMARRARGAWVTGTVAKPGPVTSAVAVHSPPAGRGAATRPAAGGAAGGERD